RPQRLLWASTGGKNPDYADTMYVSGLVAPNTVNTMPEPTLQAFADHGEITQEITADDYRAAGEVFDAMARLGIDYAEVMTALAEQGLMKFYVSCTELLVTIRTALDRSRDTHSMSRSATNSMPRRHGSSMPVCLRVCSSRTPSYSTAPRTRPSALAGWICRT